MAIKAKILRTCRNVMKLGNFQPSVKFVAEEAGVSTKTVFTHFGSIEELRSDALEDEATRAAIASVIVGPEGAGLSISTRNRVLRAVVLGSLRSTRVRPNRHHVKGVVPH